MAAARSAPDDSAAERYVADVTSGKVVVGRLVRLAVDRHVRDLEQAEAKGLRFNRVRAQRACWWIENKLRFSKGEWAKRPFILEPWQAFIVWCLFGWERWVDDRWVRRFHKAYISVARKNGKTELAAAIALLMLITGGASLTGPEIGAEVYSAATKRDQAAICWKSAASMIRKSPQLRPDLEILDSRYHIGYAETEGVFQALSAEANTLDGLGPYCAVVDELHAHPDSSVWDVLESGMGARREPLLLAITTAGAEREGVCWDVEDDLVKVLEQVYDDETMFGFVARLDEAKEGVEGDDPYDETVWIKANPTYGVSVIKDGLKIAAKAAAQNPKRQNEYLRKRMNLWTAGDTAWLSLARWDACNGTVDLEDLRGRPCYLAVDLSSTRDTTALVATFQLDDGRYVIVPKIYVPADSINDSEIRSPRERQLMTTWVKQGLVTATAGDMVDYDAVWQDILNAADRHQVVGVVFDRWGASSLLAKCQAIGIPDIGFGQGFKDMSPAMKTTEVLVGRKQIIHMGHPVLRWMVSNVSTKSDPAGNVKPDKTKSSRRIDGVVAMLMGIGEATRSGESGDGMFVHTGDPDAEDAQDAQEETA